MRKAFVAVLVAGAVLATAPGASAQDECARVVVLGLTGVTWAEVDRVSPPALLDAARDGAVGSISVRTISARTSYPSAWATISGGARIDAGRFTGAATEEMTPAPGSPFANDLQVAGLERIREDAEAAGYDAVPGALGDALDDLDLYAVGNADTGSPPPAPAGYGRWTLLAAMDEEGIVDRAAVGPGLLTDDPAAPYGVRTDQGAIDDAVTAALENDCGVTFVDPGDLGRVDEWELATGERQPEARGEALRAADAVLATIRSQLDEERDLLLILSPTTPWVEEEAHLGVAIALGPSFAASDTLQSASTRRRGLVTLPDVAPTILEHLGRDLPASMTGRPIYPVADDGDLVDEQIALDKESIFVENMKTPVTAGFVIVQVLIYVVALTLIVRRSKASGRPGDDVLARWAQLAVLGVVAFPVVTYLAGAIDQHEVGSPLVYALLLAMDLVVIVPVYFLVRDEVDRLLVVCAFTMAVLCADLVVGGPLQLNTVFGYSPIVAGRFAGLGNIAFAVLGVAALLTGVLLAHRDANRKRALTVAALVFATAVVFDGAPALGSDVGGVLALVPSFAVTLLLLAGRRIGWKVVALGALGAIVAVAGFLALDLARPAEQRTHLARLYEDVRERGTDIFVETVERKASANVRLFKSSLWTYFVPPALVAIALLMRRPRGRWLRLSQRFPAVRAGLLGGFVLAALGFLLNDSGIVIPAVILSFLVPLALIVHLLLDRETGPVAPGTSNP